MYQAMSFHLILPFESNTALAVLTVGLLAIVRPVVRMNIGMRAAFSVSGIIDNDQTIEKLNTSTKGMRCEIY